MKNQILHSIQTNLDGVNLFNYNERVVAIVYEASEITRYASQDEKKKTMDTISRVLYEFLFDIYEENLRNESVWDNYFNNVLRTTPPSLQIDKKEKKKRIENAEKI